MQSCVPGPVGAASRHPLPDAPPGDSSQYPNPKSVPPFCFFLRFKSPCLLRQLSLALGDHGAGITRESAPGWGMSTSVTAAGAMGTPQRPFPPGQGPAPGKGQGVRHPPQLRDRPHNHCTDTTPTSKLSSAEELWQDFAPARQCK